jgi:hypothetical protein
MDGVLSTHGEERNPRNVLVEKPDGPLYVSEDNIKMDLVGIELADVDWTYVNQDRD